MTPVFAPQIIDLSRARRPDVIPMESIDAALAGAKVRYVAEWNRQREADPTLPEYSVEMIEHDPAIISLRTWSGIRHADLRAVNDAIDSLLAIRARGIALDERVAGENIERGTDENDTVLLRRFLLEKGRKSLGGRDRILFEAWTACPHMGDIRLNGRSVHGRTGDLHLVIAGPGGRDATDAEMAQIRAKALDTSIVVDGMDFVARRAIRQEYAYDLTAFIPRGPDPSIVENEIKARLTAAAADRLQIGAEVPAGLAGIGYGLNVIRLVDNAPVAIVADPYGIPVMTDCRVKAEVMP